MKEIKLFQWKVETGLLIECSRNACITFRLPLQIFAENHWMLDVSLGILFPVQSLLYLRTTPAKPLYLSHIMYYPSIRENVEIKYNSIIKTKPSQIPTSMDFWWRDLIQILHYFDEIRNAPRAPMRK